jgi:hypothetical protein
MSIDDSIGFVSSVFANVAPMPSRVMVMVSSRPSRSDDARVGVEPVELARQLVEPGPGLDGVRFDPGPCQLAAHPALLRGGEAADDRRPVDAAAEEAQGDRSHPNDGEAAQRAHGDAPAERVDRPGIHGSRPPATASSPPSSGSSLTSSTAHRIIDGDLEEVTDKLLAEVKSNNPPRLTSVTVSYTTSMGLASSRGRLLAAPPCYRWLHVCSPPPSALDSPQLLLSGELGISPLCSVISLA